MAHSTSASLSLSLLRVSIHSFSTTWVEHETPMQLEQKWPQILPLSLWSSNSPDSFFPFTLAHSSYPATASTTSLRRSTTRLLSKRSTSTRKSSRSIRLEEEGFNREWHPRAWLRESPRELRLTGWGKLLNQPMKRSDPFAKNREEGRDSRRAK